MNSKVSAIALRTVVSVGILWVLASKVDLAVTWTHIQLISIPVLSGVTLLFLLQTPILAWRWHRIVMALGRDLPLPHAVRMSLLGRLFSQVLPTSIGGDVIRAVQSTRLGLDVTVAAHSVLIERVTGLVALTVIAVVALPFVWTSIADAVPIPILMFAGALAIGGILFAFALKYQTQLARLPLLRPVTDLIASFDSVFRNRGAVASLTLLGVLSNLLAILATAAIGNSLNIDAGWSIYAAVVPLSIIATIIPISVAGWGVREGAMVYLFGLFDVDSATSLAVSVIFGLALLASTLIGGLFWLLTKPPSLH